MHYRCRKTGTLQYQCRFRYMEHMHIPCHMRSSQAPAMRRRPLKKRPLKKTSPQP